MSLNYSYNSKKVQSQYEKKQKENGYGTSFILSTCAISGLPLGYFPTRKMAYRGSIPFAQLSEHDCLIAVECALVSPPLSDERKFAFWALFHKIPNSLLETQFQSLCVDWNDKKLSQMLSDRGLKMMAEFCETITTLPSRIHELFPKFRISSSFSANNGNLHELPSAVARWIGILETTKQAESEIQRADKETTRAELRLFARRTRNSPKLNLFDVRASSIAEITLYCRQLALFYEREATPQWEEFCRNPQRAGTKTIKKVIDSVREINIQEADFSDELALSAEFLKWLEEHYLDSQAREEAAKKITRLIDNADTYALQSMDISNVQELLEKSMQLDAQSGKPQLEHYPNMDKYMQALCIWRKQTKLQEKVGVGR